VLLAVLGLAVVVVAEQLEQEGQPNTVVVLVVDQLSLLSVVLVEHHCTGLVVAVVVVP